MWTTFKKRKMKHIISDIEYQIARLQRMGNIPNICVEISVNQAQQIVDALKRFPDENESEHIKYAVVFTAENKEGDTVVANCYIDLLKEPIDPLKYFAQRIEASNDVWNAVVTFFTKVN
jgi:hypothetical protein